MKKHFLTTTDIAHAAGYAVRQTVSESINHHRPNEAVTAKIIELGYVKPKLPQAALEQSLDIIYLKGNKFPYLETLLKHSNNLFLIDGKDLSPVVRIQEYYCFAAFLCQEGLNWEDVHDFWQIFILLDPPADQIIYDSISSPWPEVTAALAMELFYSFNPLKTLRIKIYGPENS